MLERLVTMKDLERNETVKTISKAVIEEIEITLKTLDENYGEERTIDIGGYVIILTTEEAVEVIETEDYVSLKDDIFEFVEFITPKHTNDWLKITQIKGNDYGVVIYMPISLMTNNLKKYLT